MISKLFLATQDKKLPYSMVIQKDENDLKARFLVVKDAFTLDSARTQRVIQFNT